MDKKKFWNWVNKSENEECPQKSVLELYGTIASESWFDDDITPEIFREELNAHTGDVDVYINSPGGDCIAASQIYTMLLEYPGHVTVKIDGLAASAASVIAMAGSKVLMAPTAMMMIYNPMTMAFGDHNEMKAAIKVLDEIKKSIINAYHDKTGLDEEEIGRLMENETWMSAKKAISLGFADDVITAECGKKKDELSDYAYSGKAVASNLYDKLKTKFAKTEKIEEPVDDGSVSVDVLYARLNSIRS